MRMLIDIMFENGLASSRGEAKRLVVQRAVTLNDVRLSGNPSITLRPGVWDIKVGKRRQATVHIAEES